VPPALVGVGIFWPGVVVVAPSQFLRGDRSGETDGLASVVVADVHDSHAAGEILADRNGGLQTKVAIQDCQSKHENRNRDDMRLIILRE